MSDAYIMSLETGFSALSVSLFKFSQKNIQEIQTLELLDKNKQSDNITSLTAKILTMNTLKYDDISYIAINAGPGSFTGLRISAAFAEGITAFSNIKLMRVSCLLAMAIKAKKESPSISAVEFGEQISVAIPAVKESYYHQIFNRDLTPLTEPTMIATIPIHETQPNRTIQALLPTSVDIAIAAIYIIQNNIPFENQINYVRGPFG